jgi:hypothetical protein
MNPVATQLLDTPARQVIGTIITFRSPKTLRVRQGRIRGISATGVRVVTPTGDPFILVWSDLLEVVNGKGAK